MKYCPVLVVLWQPAPGPQKRVQGQLVQLFPEKNEAGLIERLAPTLSNFQLIEYNFIKQAANGIVLFLSLVRRT